VTAINDVKIEKMRQNKVENEIKKNTNEVIHLTMCSDLRRGLLLTLNESRGSLSDLREALLVSSTTAIHALRMLEKAHLTTQDYERNYVLTNIGKIMSQKLIDLCNVTETVAKFEEFWLDHDITGIPKSLLQKIGCLKDATVITTDPTDIYKAHYIYVSLLKDANKINGISPIFFPDYPTIFEEIINHQAEVQLVVTADVLEKLLQTADNERLKMALNKNLKLHVITQNPRVAITASDRFMFFGLYNLKEVYDVSKLLISQSKEALAWGQALFEHYVGLSAPVTL
jgi:predicted transcriptional regulator